MPSHLAQILAFVNISGAVLALIVDAVLVVYTRRENAYPNTFLALMIGLVSVSGILASLTFSGLILQVPHLFRVDSPLHYLIPPLLYYYTKTSIYKNYRLQLWEWLFLAPAFLHLAEMVPVYLLDREEKLHHIENLLLIRKDVTSHLHNVLKNSYSGLFALLSVLVFVRYRLRARAMNFPQNRVHNRWLIYLFTVSGLYFSIWLGKFLFPSLMPVSAYEFNTTLLNLENTLGALVLLFCPQILYGAMFNTPSAPAPPPTGSHVQTPPAPAEESVPDEPVKYKSSPLSPEQKAEYCRQLRMYMEEHKPYLNKRLSLHELAFELDLSPHYLSQVINEGMDYSFLDYINSYRVEHAKQLMCSDKMEYLSIAGIASESGFNSRATFYKAFKKFTNMTPSEYAEQFGNVTAG